MDAQEILNICQIDKNIRVKESIWKYNQEQIISYDISLSHKGPQEDMTYVEKPYLLPLVPRGLTIIKARGQTILARKGLQKFFDVKEQFLNGTQKLAQADKQLKQIIFGEIQNSEIKIYKLQKANGENAQINYCKEIGAFIIASKNVSLMANSVQDLEQYADQRYYFAKLIAISWFEQLAKVPNVEELKIYLSSHAMIGEYCGNQNHQHLVRYFSIRIIFYAIVNLSDQDTCIMPDLAFKQFNKFNLETVNITDCGTYTSEQQVYDKMLQILNTVQVILKLQQIMYKYNYFFKNRFFKKQKYCFDNQDITSTSQCL